MTKKGRILSKVFGERLKNEYSENKEIANQYWRDVADKRKFVPNCVCGHSKDVHLRYGSRTANIPNDYYECTLCRCKRFRNVKMKGVKSWQKKRK